ALITAGGSEICRIVAELFIQNGAKVYIGDVDEALISDFISNHSVANGRVCDVSDAKEAEKLVQAAGDWLGGLDILINGAGIGGPAGKVEDIDPTEWDRTLAVNINGTFYCTKYAVPLLRRSGGGSIVNFSSAAGIMGYPLRSPYAAAKWAVEGFTKTMAMELGPDNIRANTIIPGCVEGERMNRVIRNEAKAKGLPEDQVRESVVRGISMKTFVTAGDVANMILFICSKAGSRINGQSIGVDGYTETLR
ncbi:MAG: SDR family oxidoreductase, partial [Deltaproteobacteria bacterium]|nr:SDR family oxidoreductase [Deltaproteobacteria bacterium]